jgi:thiamine kinase-like enzyme
VYLKLPNSLQYLVPRVFNYSLSCEDPFVELEYYGYPSLSDVFVYGNYDLGVWYHIFEAIFFSLEEMGKHKLECSSEEIKSAQKEMYVKKTMARVKGYSKFFNDLMEKRLTINGTKHKPLKVMLSRLDVLFDKIIKGSSLNIIHGDFCLSNMLFDPKQRILKLIDPRGKFARFSIYGDFRYDLAKLSHSFLGNYDFIINDRFSVMHDGNKIDYIINKKDKQQKISDMFEHNLKKRFVNDIIQIRFIEALLFISMIPLHSDHKDRQLLMFCTGLKELSEIHENQ